MKKFEFFDVTADIGFYAYGNNLNEAFENAGLALFNIISKTDNINPITFIIIWFFRGTFIFAWNRIHVIFRI